MHGGSEQNHGAMCLAGVHYTTDQVEWCMAEWHRTKLHGAQSMMEVNRTIVHER